MSIVGIALAAIAALMTLSAATPTIQRWSERGFTYWMLAMLIVLTVASTAFGINSCDRATNDPGDVCVRQWRAIGGDWTCDRWESP